MLDKKKVKAPKPKSDMDFDTPRVRKSKDSKYNNSKYWLSQEDDLDDEDFDITAIFGKDEEE